MMFDDQTLNPQDPNPLEPDPPAPQHGHARRAFLIGFGGAVALGLFCLMAVLATGALSRLTQAAARRVAGTLHPNVINEEAAKNRLRQAGGADLSFPLPQARILVCKEFSELTLFNGDRFVKRYKAVLGKLPEGTFKIKNHEQPRKAELIAITLDYPRTADADAALKVGTITQAQRDAIATAEQNHKLPPDDTPLGGAVVIHGTGTPNAAASGIGLTDERAAEIFTATTLGTPVTIEK